MLISISSLYRRVLPSPSHWVLPQRDMIFWRKNINIAKAITCSTVLIGITIILADIWFGFSRNFLLVTFDIIIVFFLFCILQIRKNNRMKGRNSWPVTTTSILVFIINHTETDGIFKIIVLLGILIYWGRHHIKDYHKVQKNHNEWEQEKDDFSTREADFQEYLLKKESFQAKEKMSYLKNLVYFDHLSINLEKTEFNSQILVEILPYLRPRVQQTAKELIQVYSNTFSITTNKNIGNLTIALKTSFYLNFDAIKIIETDLHNIFSHKSLHPNTIKPKTE